MKITGNKDLKELVNRHYFIVLNKETRCMEAENQTLKSRTRI